MLHRYRNSTSDFSLNTRACSLIAALHYAGRMFGCILAAFLVDRIGRSKILVFNASCGCLVWLTVLLTKSLPLHYAIRLLVGLGVASVDVAVPLYIGENSSPHIRGLFGSAGSFAFYSGELIAFVVCTYTSYESAAIVLATLSFAVLLSTVWLREPAQFLLAKGHHQQAQERFFSLRGCTEDTRLEFQQMQRATEEPLSVALLTSKSMRAVCMVSCYLFISGFAPINAMSSLAFSSIESFTPNELTTMLGVAQLVAIFFSSSIIDRIGRRPLLMVSAAACVLIHVSIATLYYCQEMGIEVPHLAWMLVIFIGAYLVLAATIILPLMNTVRGELLSPQLKSVGGCIAVFVSSIISVTSAGLFLPVAELYGMKANFIGFAAMSFGFLVFVYFDLPETKGLTLTQIQFSLKK